MSQEFYIESLRRIFKERQVCKVTQEHKNKRTIKQQKKKGKKTIDGRGTADARGSGVVKAKSKKIVREPQTMEELLEMEGVELRGLNRGDVVEGRVSEIGPKSVYIDIGAKTEGLVADREFSMAESYIKTLQPGDKVDAYVLSPENESGQIILSLRQAAADYIWKQVEEWLAASEVLKLKVKEVNRGGAIVEVIDELTGFVPTSQISGELNTKLEELVGKEMEVKIIDASREEAKIILSEKVVSEAEDLAKKRMGLQLLEEGRVYEGEVIRVVPFGLFVRLTSLKKEIVKLLKAEEGKQDRKKKSARDVIAVEDGKGERGKKAGEMDLDEELLPEGLVHISELSWEKVDNPEDIAKVGDKVKVMVLQVDPKVGKLSFSMKRLTPDPWEKIKEKYTVDKQVKGVVTEVMPFGVFVKLEPGISGLIHVSKLLGKSLKPGDKVDCYVESIDAEGRRLSLDLVLKAKPIGYK